MVAYDVDGRLCPIGLSSSGLAVTVFNLQLSHKEGFEQASLTVQCLLWELLLGQYSLESAQAWLETLPVPFMCGAAVLLGDETGSFCAELSAEGVRLVHPATGAPIVRANHELHEDFRAGYVGSKKARMKSAKRAELLLRSLAETCTERGGPRVPLTEAQADAINEARRRKEQKLAKKAGTAASGHTVDDAAPKAAAVSSAAPPPLSGAVCAGILAKSRRVMNVGVLATIVCDVRRRELTVTFKDRQRMLAEEVVQLGAKLKLTSDRLGRFLQAGAFVDKAELGRPRIDDGKAANHLVRWARSTHALPELAQRCGAEP